MALFILSFIAGVLTVAAPCVLPLLPIIIGGSVLEGGKDTTKKQWLRPLVISGSLAVSVILFTLLIKATTALLGVPQVVWQTVSAVIVGLIGFNYLWPKGWEVISSKLNLSRRSNVSLGKAYQNKGLFGAVLIGAALGPVFSSCSPTYALIVATVIPVSFFQGFLYLLAYSVGMSSVLLLISYIGQAFVVKLRWLSNPNGLFKRLIGVLFIVVALVILFGVDKKVQSFVLEKGWYDPISNIEKKFTE